jgi:hypothetical protein
MPRRVRAPRRPPRFSVVTIVRNEARRLPRLIESLGEFRERGGEVVVLDTGSDDGTPEVAAELGAVVASEPRRFNGALTARQAARIHARFSRGAEGPFVRQGERLFHFAKARAHAATLARHAFQLAVDGGDVVEALDIDFLDSIADDPGVTAAHFETRILTPLCWQRELRDYVYDRRIMEWRGRAHNYLASRSGKPIVPPRRLTPAQLLVSHHSDLEKARGYQFAGMALDALAEPRSVRCAFFLARALTAGGFPRSGLDLAMGLDRAEAPPGIRSAGLCFAARCRADLGAGPDEIDGLLFRAAQRDPTRRDPLLRLARRCLAQGELQAAASFAVAALAIPARVNVPEPEENLTTGPHAILYWALLWLGRAGEARSHFERCRALDPGNPLYAEHAALFGMASR